MKVTYIDHMGSDNSVVDAARVSFSKKADQYSDEQNAKLINYLSKHNHWTPFGHTAITLHIKAPIFVARQLGKHQVGMVWNEVSRRYVSDHPELYWPEEIREKADNVKQGSGGKHPTINHGVGTGYYAALKETTWMLVEEYLGLIEDGVCPEQARMILPQNTYTEWYWTGNLYSFANVWKLRTDSHTQRETQEVAKQIGEIIEPLFPVSWSALTKGS